MNNKTLPYSVVATKVSSDGATIYHKLKCNSCGHTSNWTTKSRMVCDCQYRVEYTPHGVGTELKKILSSLGFDPTEEGCQCNHRASIMDRLGIDWCENNLPTILGWLKEEHKRRKSLLPWSDIIVRGIVRRAIRNAKLKETPIPSLELP